jgi:hypothetical protein
VRFDEQSLVSCAGLVPVWSLAEQTGLTGLLERVRFQRSKLRSGAVNPAGKLACVIAGMTAGADCIDELEVVRAGGMTSLFDGVYAPATWGILLREFSFGHTQQPPQPPGRTWSLWPRGPRLRAGPRRGRGRGTAGAR